MSRERPRNATDPRGGVLPVVTNGPATAPGAPRASGTRAVPAEPGNGTLPGDRGVADAIPKGGDRSPPHRHRTSGEDPNLMRGPMGDFVRRALSWGIVSSLLLPILALVVIGLGALLSALGDAIGARFCGRVALLAAVIWLLAVVATAVLAGIAALAAEGGRRCGEPGRHRLRKGPRRHRRRRLRERMEGEPQQEVWGDRPGDGGRSQRRDPGAG